MKKTILVMLMFVSTMVSAQLCLSNYTNVASTQPNGIASGDFNNDGKLDLVTSVYGSSAICVYVGDGAGSFSNSPSYTFAANTANSYKISTGDFNNDSNLDMAVSSSNSGQVALLFGSGTGTFAAATPSTAPSMVSVNDLFAADFNGDSKLDLAVIGANSSSVTIYYGNGNSTSTFSSTISYSLNLGGVPNSISAAFLNSDSYYDLVFTSAGSTSVAVLLSSGAGTFNAPVAYQASNVHTDSYLGFVNSDNVLDIVVSSMASPSVQVIYGTGSGAFSTTPVSYSAPNYKNIVAIDLNMDGYIDVAGVNGNTLSIMPGNSTGFGSLVTYTVGSNSTEILAADFNSNGNMDIALTSYGTNSLSIFLNSASVLNSSTSWVICNGNSSTLTASGATSYTLNGNALTSTTVVNPSTNTTYTLIGSAGGCTTSVVKTLTVNAVPSLSLSGINPICIGSTSNFSVTGANTYSWSTGSTLSAVAVSPTVNTTYSVTGTNLNNCSSTTSVVLAVNPLPVLNITGQNVICTGNSATLTASGAATYTWVAPNSTATTIVVTPNSNSTYYVSGTDNNGCVNITLKSILVNQLPTVSISGSSVICYGNSTNLVSNGALSYVWSTNSTSTSILVNPTTATTYSVVGTDVSGCSNTASTTVFVNALPIVTISGTSVMCSGNTATLTVSGALTYAWSNNSTLTSLAVSPMSNTTYSVVGIDANGCMNSASKTITVNATPNVVIAGSNGVCLGESLTFTVSGANSYTWSNGSNFVTFASTPTSNVTYSVLGVSENGCENTAVISVTVSQCLGFSKVSKQEVMLNIFPNPNNGNFTIQSEVDLSVKVLNELGQVVKVENLNQDNNKQLNINDLASGLYYIVCSGNGQSVTKKVIVSK